MHQPGLAMELSEIPAICTPLLHFSTCPWMQKIGTFRPSHVDISHPSQPPGILRRFAIRTAGESITVRIMQDWATNHRSIGAMLGCAALLLVFGLAEQARAQHATPPSMWAPATLDGIEGGLEYTPGDEPFPPQRSAGLLSPGRPRCRDCPWTFQFLPDGLLYHSYLAGEKEPRFSGALLWDTQGGTYLDAVLGGRVGIFRYGSEGPRNPQGWQLDVEGAAFPRLNIDENHDLESADFRFGVPFTSRRGPLAVKFAYYHISSHVGDEFLVRNPGFVRVNYVRDALVYGLTYSLNPDLKIYGEVSYAFYVAGGAEPWEFQFGAEYSPAVALCPLGAPFLAVNGHTREEVDFGGSVNVIGGWEWRSRRSDRQIRVGAQYFNGKSSQYAFFSQHEELLGFGIWFDY